MSKGWCKVDDIINYLKNLPPDKRSVLIATIRAELEQEQQQAEVEAALAAYANQEQLLKELEQRQMLRPSEDDYGIPPYTR